MQSWHSIHFFRAFGGTLGCRSHETSALFHNFQLVRNFRNSFRVDRNQELHLTEPNTQGTPEWRAQKSKQ
eukprot:71703-Amphidinium_carterae.1